MSFETIAFVVAQSNSFDKFVSKGALLKCPLVVRVWRDLIFIAAIFVHFPHFPMCIVGQSLPVSFRWVNVVTKD